MRFLCGYYKLYSLVCGWKVADRWQVGIWFGNGRKDGRAREGVSKRQQRIFFSSKNSQNYPKIFLLVNR